MNAPTYDLQPRDSSGDEYLAAVQRLGNWVVESGQGLRTVIDTHSAFVSASGYEAPRTSIEYLLEALLLGVLWRSRGQEAIEPKVSRQQLISELVRERRDGAKKRRDSTTAALVTLFPAAKIVSGVPSAQQIHHLLDWLVASGEYDDESQRLRIWCAMLAAGDPHVSHDVLNAISEFARCFERAAEQILGRFTWGVDEFHSNELAGRPAREDTVQCSRRRPEYHLNMVGAELLNSAWRKDFLACQRHVVVMPGCARLHQGKSCKASVALNELRCNHCSTGCLVSAATRLAHRTGAEAFAVTHGSDFSSFLASLALSGGDVGIIGVACAPGLMGAGWRARDKGLPAQCVLLNKSGCEHWLERAEPTSFDLRELARILSRPESQASESIESHVA